jgi:aspartyl-tRNA(Asn)/glutamyl-tRNA(Gln) amidotransferase subunit A
MTAPLYTLTIEAAAAGLATGEFTSVELTMACLEHIAAYDTKINAFIRVEKDLALRQAAASDARRAAGQTLGTLDGIPYNLKDVYATSDSPTTAASHMLKDWTAPYNATVYSKLCEAGAVLLGKTNTDEFTMGVSTETSYYAVTRNPWDIERVAGGSSGGPAAATAMHFGMFSIGTDTGGSIRGPAAFCGVTGLRATYGRISRFGEIAMASSLDQTGPITKTARDAAIILQVLAGQDPLDATSSPESIPNYLDSCTETSLTGLRVGVPAEYFGEGVNPEVEAHVREAIAELEKLGATIVPVSIPSVAHALAVYYIICPAEVSSNMSRYDGIRYGYSIEREHPEDITDLYSVYAESREQGIGAEVKRRIMLGTHVLSSGYYDAYYKKAQAVRAVVMAEFAAIFQQVDVLAAPVSPHVAFKVGSQIDDPLAMYKEDVLTVPVNIAQLPGMSVPCGFVQNLPVGLQLIADRFQEGLLCRVGAAYQTATDHHQQTPLLLRNS